MRDSKRDTDVLNSFLDSVGEGEGGMILENGVEICKLSYVKQISSPGSMSDTGCSGGSGWRPHVHPWWIQVNVWQNQYNVVK